MKISAPQIKGVQSLGRANLSALGGVASGVSAVAKAERAAFNNAAQLASEFAQREDKASFDSTVADTRLSENNWVSENGAREFFDGKELSGKVDGVELSDKGTDQYGDEIDIPKKRIPAYKVYPQLLEKKLTGDMHAKAKNILNPLDRQAFIESRSVYIADETRTAQLKAMQDQNTYQRAESDAKMKQANLSGDKVGADLLASNFNGSELEISERLRVNAEQKEIYDGDALIRIEDTSGIKDMLNYLKVPDYTQKGGPLTDRQNINLQNRLESKLGGLTVRREGVYKVYKEELTQAAQDMNTAQDNGVIQKEGDVDKMRKRLDDVGLSALSIDVRRAEHKAVAVDKLNKVPEILHAAIVSESVRGMDKNKAEAFAADLTKKSQQIAREVQKDPNGFYQKQHLSEPIVPGTKAFFKRSVSAGREASAIYRTPFKALTDEVANNLATQFEGGTIEAKKAFITQVLIEVPEKKDQDVLFTQIDQKKNGNLNVYADMLERGDGPGLKLIEEGRLLRQDKKLDLTPDDLTDKINVELNGIFMIPSERQQYREAVMDYYARTANEDGELGKQFTNTTRMDNAVKAVVGNFVEYGDSKLLLPNNQIDGDGFEDWVDNLPPAYIDQLGGVKGMTGAQLLENIRSGGFRLRPSKKRGEYLITDVRNDYLKTNDPKDGQPINFTLVFDRTQRRTVVDAPFLGHSLSGSSPKKIEPKNTEPKKLRAAPFLGFGRGGASQKQPSPKKGTKPPSLGFSRGGE